MNNIKCHQLSKIVHTLFLLTCTEDAIRGPLKSKSSKGALHLCTGFGPGSWADSQSRCRGLPRGVQRGVLDERTHRKKTKLVDCAICCPTFFIHNEEVHFSLMSIFICQGST